MLDQRGFTLIETLMALAMLGLVTAALFTFYYSGVTAWHRGAGRMDHQQNARIAVDLVDRELRFARWVEIPREGEIRYKLKDDPRQEDMQYYRRFRLSGEQLLMEEIEGGKIHACNVAALGIGGLSFSLDDCGNVHVAVAAGGAGDRVALQSSVSPRNIARCGAARAERG